MYVSEDGVFFNPGERLRSGFYHGGDGFQYHENGRTLDGMTLHLRCIKYHTLRCPGRATWTAGFGIRRTRRLHNHQPNYLRPLEKLLMSNILERVRTGDFASFRKIVNEERQYFPRNVQALVTLERMSNSMQNLRALRYPGIPDSLDELANILESPQFAQISASVDGFDNIYSAKVEALDGTKSIIFVSQRMLRYMERVQIIFGDGTFCTPALPATSQVFNIVTLWRYHIIPLVVCLMERRTKYAYLAIFEHLTRMSPNFSPEIVMSDFEAGLQGAFAQHFPWASIQGCLYHYVAAVMSYAKDELHMTALMRNNPVIKRVVQLCCAIPLAPQNMMQAAMAEIAAEAQATLYYGDLIPFFLYLWNTWLTGARSRFLSVSGSMHRTNNACESFHRIMVNEIGVHHPNIYRFIEILTKLEDVAYTDLWTLYNGDNPSRARKTSAIANDRRIISWTQDLEQGHITIRDFIHLVSPSVAGLVQDHL